MLLKGELAIQNRFCLNFSEKNMAAQEMAVGGVRMRLQVLSDRAVGFGKLGLLEKDLSVGEKRIWLFGRLNGICGSQWGREKKKRKKREKKGAKNLPYIL